MTETMTDKDIVQVARWLKNQAYARYMRFDAFYRDVKHGDWEEAWMKVHPLDIRFHNPQLYEAILERLPKEEN